MYNQEIWAVVASAMNITHIMTIVTILAFSPECVKRKEIVIVSLMTIIIIITMVADVQVRKEVEKSGCLIPNAKIMTEESIMILAEMTVLAIVNNMKKTWANAQVFNCYLDLISFQRLLYNSSPSSPK